MCIHYFCASCKVIFTGEGAIEPCIAQYTVPPNKRDPRICPANNVKYVKREEGQHENSQPCPGPIRYTRAFASERAYRSNDYSYVRPGDLFLPGMQARVAAMFGRSYHGQSLAKANEEGNNSAPNGTYSLFEAASGEAAEAVDDGNGDVIAPEYEWAAVKGRRAIPYTGAVKVPRKARGKQKSRGLR